MPHIHPVSELRTNFNQLAEICRKEHEPVFLTNRGRGDLVLIGLEEYEQLVHEQKKQTTFDPALEMLWVREAEARYDQIKTGAVTCRQLDEVIDEACKELL